MTNNFSKNEYIYIYMNFGRMKYRFLLIELMSSPIFSITKLCPWHDEANITYSKIALY